MPRFASGFISFLALQGFKNLAIKLMPNDGFIQGVSWIDIFISYIGIMMGLSVTETVVAQYVAETTSTLVSLKLDLLARWSFPAVFIVGMVLMAVLGNVMGEMLLTLYVTHAFLVVFTVAFYGYGFYQTRYFPAFFLRDAVRKGLSSSERHKLWRLGEPELQRIFDHLDGLTSSSSDVVEVEVLVEFLCHSRPILAQHRDLVLDITEATFATTTSFAFPAFRNKFSKFITQLNIVLNCEGEEMNRELVSELSDNPTVVETLLSERLTVRIQDEFDDDVIGVGEEFFC
jgi:hypothetical protein